MKIGIVGLGAMGTLICTHLLKHRSSPSLQIRALVRKRNYDELCKNGLELCSSSSKKLLHYKNLESVFCIDTFHDKMDVIILTVKSYDLRRTFQLLAKDNSNTYSNTLWVTLQNGIGHQEILHEIFPSAHACRGLTYMGAHQIETTKVCYAGKGITYIEKIGTKEEDNKIDRLKELMGLSGLECEVVDQNAMNTLIWKKLMVNAVINPIASILQKPNKCILEGISTKQLVEDICEEILLVAEHEGVKLNCMHESVRDVLKVAEKTGENICSMLADLRNRKQTENEFISGAIVRCAKKHGLSVPKNEMLHRVIQFLEEKHHN